MDDELRLRWMPGQTNRLVVVFMGMHGGVGGQPLDEFAGSASSNGTNNVLFVTDRRASWYAAPGLWRRIVRLIRYMRKSEGIREIITLGNSMGGYGALLLPRDLRVARAIAFSPQVTMDRSILDDQRWPDVQKRWGTLPVRSVAEMIDSTRTEYYLAAGGDCAEDLAHLDLIPEMPRVHRFIFPGAQHNLARALKQQGLLHDMVTNIARGRRARVKRLLATYSEQAA
ncbi:MAG: hypothetical protein AAGE03_09545 [Pseudomonadota bacterium]